MVGEPPRSPARLDWEDPVEKVKGLGRVGGEKLRSIGTATVADLVWTLPVAWDDARAPLTVAEALAQARASPGARVCFRAVVKSAGLVPMRGRRAVRVVVADEARAKESVTLWWFFTAHGTLAVAEPGRALLVTGRIRVDPGKAARMAHPEIARDEEAARVVRPRYARSGVPEGTLRKAVRVAVEGVRPLPDFVPAAVAARETFPDVEELLPVLHAVAGRNGAPDRVARMAGVERLAWAEAFTRAWQRVTLDADDGERRRAIPLPVDRAAHARLRAELGFTLTREQEKAIGEIARDLARPVPMRRLLFGDVGTGKTAVALAAAAQCVAAGAQVAILAPTSVLAEQYMEAVGPLARASGASVALVAAGVPSSQRERREAALARGALTVAIGTHALLGEKIGFKRLGLVIVDEQHRLGVGQRLALTNKAASDGARPHLLTLSATPIPRTLALALRGDLATSELGARPKGRPPVATELRVRSDFAAVVKEVAAVCARGERAFVIAPRIEEGEDEGAEGSVEVAQYLTKALSRVRVGLVHGGLAADEKRAAMSRFRSGETQVLVGTTVVEVGVDVPQATLMVVCAAERFGLAQLHQLRGRVGRGDQPGRCVLVHADVLDPLARARLEAIARLDRGVDVARADLELRGAGDLGGTRQSGAPGELLYLDPASPPPWLTRIEVDARAIFAADPALEKQEHRALRLAVQRFATAISAREDAG